MTHNQYEALFEEIARKHVDIMHTDDECHFAVVAIGDGIFRNIIDLSEYKEGKRSRLHTPFLLLITRKFEFDDNKAGRRAEDNKCIFVVADKYTRGNHAEKRQVWNTTEVIGKEILGYLYENINKKRPKTQGNDMWVNLGDSSGNNIGPFDDNFVGTRFEIMINHGINAEIKYQPTKFGE